MSLFEVSGKLMTEDDSGKLSVEKRVLLVEGHTFTDIECVFLDWLNKRTEFPEHTVIESIKRVKIEKIYENEILTITDSNGMRELIPEDKDNSLWELTSQFELTNETGTIKYIKEKYIVPAESQKDAIVRLEKIQSDTFADGCKIVNGKESSYYACLVINYEKED